MDVDTIFSQLSIVIALGSGIALIMSLLRQPLIIGHILTGIIAGPVVLNIIPEAEILTVMGSLGVSLLLFVVGLELSPKIITRLRRVVFITTIVQTAIITFIGAGVARLFEFGRLESLIIGLCLAMSSTIIIATLLQQKKEIMRLYAQIAIGVLILQDLIATAGKVTLSAHSGGEYLLEAGMLIIKGILYLVTVLLIGRLVFPRLSKALESSKELLLIVSIGWALGVAVTCAAIGFSIEVGALLAGMSLASLPFSLSMATQLRPIRDFFVIVFLVSLGHSLALEHITGIWPEVLAFTLLVLVLKPLVVLATLGAQGYTKRASFKTAVSMSQVSEFSLVFVVAAAHHHYVGGSVLAAISLTALVTFVLSPYLIRHDDWLFRKFESHLRLFERRVTRLEQKSAANSYPVVLFGYRKGGLEFIRTFKKMQKRFVVVDYDPEAVELIEKQHVDFMYGDATDAEFVEELQLDKSQFVVSTISDFTANEFLMHWLHEHNPRAVFIGSADNAQQAAELYARGAAYVMLPHFIGSEKVSNFIKRVGFKKSEFHKFRERHLLYLESYHGEEPA